MLSDHLGKHPHDWDTARVEYERLRHGRTRKVQHASLVAGKCCTYLMAHEPMSETPGLPHPTLGTAISTGSTHSRPTRKYPMTEQAEPGRRRSISP